MKINLTAIEIKDLNNTVYKVDDLNKQIGNILFVNAESIEVSDKARILHGGSEADVTEMEMIQMINIVVAHPYYKPFVQAQIINYLTDILTKHQHQKEEETKHD